MIRFLASPSWGSGVVCSSLPKTKTASSWRSCDVGTVKPLKELPGRSAKSTHILSGMCCWRLFKPKWLLCSLRLIINIFCCCIWLMWFLRQSLLSLCWGWVVACLPAPFLGQGALCVLGHTLCDTEALMALGRSHLVLRWISGEDHSFVFETKILYGCFHFVWGQRETETDTVEARSSIWYPGWLSRFRASPDQSLEPGSRFGSPKHLAHHLLSPRICVYRKLELQVELDPVPRHS